MSQHNTQSPPINNVITQGHHHHGQGGNVTGAEAAKPASFADNFQEIDLNAPSVISDSSLPNHTPQDPLTNENLERVRGINNDDVIAEEDGVIGRGGGQTNGTVIRMGITEATSKPQNQNLRPITMNGTAPNEAIVKPYNVQNGSPPSQIPTSNHHTTVAIVDHCVTYPYVMAKSSSPELRHVPKVKREGCLYARGDLMVTVKPMKSSCVWVTPAKFDVHSVPAEFMDPQLAVTADDYNMAMEFLTNDYRFNCYNLCYRRIILAWLLFGFLILISILFSRLNGAVLFGLGIIWLLINTVGIFVCLFIKKRMNSNLDDAVSTVNRILVKKNILAGLEDQGKLSCHKILIHFVYYDIGDCMTEMTQILERKGLKNKGGKDIMSSKKKGQNLSNGEDMEYNLDVEEIIDGNSSNLKLNYYQSYAEKVLLRNSQSYIKNMVRGRLTIPHPELPTSKTIRHVKGNFCLCQYVEDYYFLAKENKWYHAFF